MHVIVSWQILPRPPQGSALAQASPLAAAFGDDTSVLDAEMRGVLAPYSWVMPLPNFFVVQVADSQQVQQITNGLVGVATKHQDRIYVLISPPMSGGRYVGRLPNNLWPEINSRST
jgi:hypothetical protein